MTVRRARWARGTVRARLIMTTPIDTVSRIALNYDWIIAPAVGIALLLAARRWLGRWPDLWQFRRAVLPVLDRLADSDYDDELDAVDDRLADAGVDVDLEAAADALPEKTGLPLNARTFVGTVDAPPAEIREEFREMERWWPCWLASIQYDVGDGERVYEVGSYAFRSEGLLDPRQVHVRLTPRVGGKQTALWAHEEYSPWRRPVAHYRGEAWSAERGVRHVASLFASDERFEASDQPVNIV